MKLNPGRFWWSLIAALIVLPPFTGCEVQQADVDAARRKAADERRDVGEAVRDSARDLGEAGREAREEVAEEVREATAAEREADRLENELAMKKERDAWLLSAKTRLAEVDSLIEKKRLALGGLSETQRELAESEVKLMDEQRDLLADAIKTAEGEALTDWAQHKPLVEQALQRLKDAGQG